MRTQHEWQDSCFRATWWSSGEAISAECFTWTTSLVFWSNLSRSHDANSFNWALNLIHITGIFAESCFAIPIKASFYILASCRNLSKLILARLKPQKITQNFRPLMTWINSVNTYDWSLPQVDGTTESTEFIQRSNVQVPLAVCQGSVRWSLLSDGSDKQYFSPIQPVYNIHIRIHNLAILLVITECIRQDCNFNKKKIIPGILIIRDGTCRFPEQSVPNIWVLRSL